MKLNNKISGENVIPVALDPPQPDPAVERRYVMSMRSVVGVQGNRLQLFFSSAPPDYDPDTDGPLEMSVPPGGCRLVLELDPTWNWRFRTDGDAVTLGVQEPPPGAPPTTRYWNLVSAGGERCLQVSFNAKYYDIEGENFDPYNIYVNLDQDMPDGAPAPTLSIKIDPDIQNPGDTPP